jgi:hypothetical protein
MMMVYFGFLLYQPGDENLVVDPLLHLKHYLDCDAGVPIDNGGLTGEFKVYPNPAKGFINVAIPINTIFSTEIYSSTGQLVSKTNNQPTINVSKLNSGIYILKVSYNGKTYTKKVVIYN